jgi:hypothetical protein
MPISQKDTQKIMKRSFPDEDKTLPKQLGDNEEV